jgi:hypothetical protein
MDPTVPRARHQATPAAAPVRDQTVLSTRRPAVLTQDQHAPGPAAPRARRPGHPAATDLVPAQTALRRQHLAALDVSVPIALRTAPETECAPDQTAPLALHPPVRAARALDQVVLHPAAQDALDLTALRTAAMGFAPVQTVLRLAAQDVLAPTALRTATTTGLALDRIAPTRKVLQHMADRNLRTTTQTMGWMSEPLPKFAAGST